MLPGRYLSDELSAQHLVELLQVPSWEVLPHRFERKGQSLWLVDLCLFALLSQPPDLVSASRHNPFEIISPFIRAAFSIWLEEIRITHVRRRDIALLDEHVQDAETSLECLREMQMTVEALFGASTVQGVIVHPLIRDVAFVIERFEHFYQAWTNKLSHEASMASLEESRLGIQQNKDVKRLTELALVFIPLSLVTSTFGMNVDVLSGKGAKWWTVIIGVVIIYSLVALMISTFGTEDRKRRKKEGETALRRFKFALLPYLASSWSSWKNTMRSSMMRK